MITQTFGKIITDTEDQPRDAIHIAVAAVYAGEMLYPCDEVGFLEKETEKVGRTVKKPIGIVDPFLKGKVFVGQRFWLWMFPNTITSLRHAWTHPAFEGRSTPTEDQKIEANSRKWIEDFADRIGQSYDSLMEAAELYAISGEYTYDNTESYKHDWDSFTEFWLHYQIVTGKSVKKENQGTIFTCSC